jgi:hypothetical protein
MVNRILTSFCICLCAVQLLAQSSYSSTNFRVAQTVYQDISATGTAIAITNAEAGSSIAPVEIGFSFNFFGTSFAQFMLHADGIMRMGTLAPGAASAIATNPSFANGAVFTSTTAAFQNIVMPFFTNLIQGQATPQFHVQTSGTAPNRVCTIQWKNLADADNAGTDPHQFANLEFQVKLYETSNDIEFIYGTFIPSARVVEGRNAVCGIKANSNTFFGLYRLNSAMPFQKAVVFNPSHHGRIAASYPFRNTVLPGAGFANRFFGRVATDINVGNVYLDSISPLGSQTSGRVEALVVNEGTNPANDIAVTLNIAGSNTHTGLVNIASLAAGASQLVSFPTFNLANIGQQDVQVAVSSTGDERVANNTFSKKQVISQSHHQTFDFSTSSNLGVGFNSVAGNITAVKIYGSGTRKLRQIRVPFGSYRNLVNVRVYEDEGTGGEPSNTALFTSSNFLTTSENIMMVPVGDSVSVTGDYYVAVQQTTTANMGWRILLNPPRRSSRNFTRSAFGNWSVDGTNPPWENMLEVYEETPAADIGIESQTTTGCDYANSSEVKVALRNFSADPIDFAATPATITGKMTNPAGAEFLFTIPKSSGVLAAGAVEEITVLNNYDFSRRGFHRINARTILAGDAEAGNDSLSFFINNSIAVARSVTDAICPFTTVTLTGPAFLANLQWNVEGSISSGTSLVLAPLKTTVVKVSGIDYRNCLLQDSIIITVKGEGLPPRPILIFGDTLLSHRNGFKDTVRIKKLDGHTISWLGGIGIPTADSALIINQMAGLNGAKIAGLYIRTADGCANVSDTISYAYAAGVLHNENSTLSVCDTSYYDFNGPSGVTGNNFTRTFTPATPGGKVKLTIYKLDLASFASLSIFDGASASSPRIEALSNAQNGNTTREFISSDASGAITVQFTGGSSTSSGWWAGLTCYTPEVYRTVADGNWITAANWERKSPGGNYVAATRPPLKADDTVHIRHNMILTRSQPMDQIVVETGATLGLENPGVNTISMPAYKTVDQPEFLVKGTLNISPRVQIFGTNGQMFIQGRLNNFGSIDLDTVVFNGTAPQTLGDFSGASGLMKILRLDNPAGLTMGSDQNVYGIDFVSGMLTTDSENLLTLSQDDFFTTGARDDAHVNGPVAVTLTNGIGTRLYPIGSKGRYRPVILKNDNAITEGGNESIVVSLQESAPPARTLPASISKVSELRHYRISRTGTPNALDFKITLPYLQDDGVTDPNNLTIAKDNGADAWLDIGGAISGAVPGIIESNTFSNFSDFVLANKIGGGNLLPVTWLGFTAVARQGSAYLEWQTAHEINCKRYEVERSIDGVNFSRIGSEICRNAYAPQSYSYVDAFPGFSTVYYRIKQVDNDGKFEYSEVRMLAFDTDGKIVIYPNPARDRVVITGLSGNSDIRLYDAGGRMVLVARSAERIGQLNVAHLPAGIYQISITLHTGERVVKKLQLLK